MSDRYGRFGVGSLNWEGSGQRAGEGEEEGESTGALSSRSAAIAFQSLSLFVTAARILRCRICESVSLRWPVLVPQALATFLSFQGASIKKRGRKEGGKTLLAGCLVFHHKSSPPSHWKATLTSEHKRQIALVPSRLGFLVNS